jgi:hypothetical protein
VPYADFGDPQSLNQYSYVRNLPTTRIDEDGHDGGTAVLEPVEEAVAAVREFVAIEAPGGTSGSVSGAGRLGFVATVGVALGLEAKSFIDAHANNVKADADMEMVRALAPQDQAAAKAAYERVQQTVKEAQESKQEPEPAPASGGNMKGNGRGGKQERLKELGKDQKVSSADRGEIKRDQNQIARGTRSTIRVPGNKDLAHRRGQEARKGYNYKHSDLQNKDLHRLLHKHEGYK